MRFFLATIFYLILNINSLSAQVVDKLKYTLTYKLTLQVDSTNERKKSERMLLQVGDSIEKFIGLSQERMDSVGRVMEQSEERNDIDMGHILKAIGQRPIEKYRIFKLKKKRQYRHQEGEASLNRFVYFQPMDSLMQWDIEADTMSISGYKCQKATTHFAGRDYIAWFTTALPLKAAPYKFDGLPGTIIYLADTRRHYTFEFLGLQVAKEEEEIIMTATKLIEVEREQIFKQRKKLTQRTVYDVLTEGGVEIHGSEESMRMLHQKKFTLSNNNPIELE